MKSFLLTGLILVGLAVMHVAVAQVGCVTKAAKATAGTESSAKWYVMETIVQQVSWGLWPGWVANGKLPGYTVSNEHYKCAPGGMGVTCTGQATICKKS